MSTALVVIDMQEVFANSQSPWGSPSAYAVAGDIRRLHESSVFTTTIWTRFISASRPSGAWIDYFEKWPFALANADDHIWDVIPTLADIATPTLDLPTMGKWGAPMQSLLPKDCDELVVCGVATDCCVISTVLPAIDDGMHVVVLEDLCVGSSPENQLHAIENMRLYEPLTEVTDSLTWLSSRSRD